MVTPKIELTKLKLDNLKPAPPGERYEIADTHVNGLRVRVGDGAVETGRHRGKASQITFVLLARFPPSRNATRKALGRYAQEFPQLTLQAAREKAAHWKSLIAAGRNPVAEAEAEQKQLEADRKAAEDAVRNRLTLRDALDRYDDDRLVHLRRGRATRRALDGKAGLLTALGEREPNSIVRADISEAVRTRAKTSPISANRQLAYTSAFFGWCVAEGLIETNPAANIRKPGKETQRDRYHSLDELADIWAASCQLGYPFAHLYQLLIALPMRREEVAAIQVDELDLGTDENPDSAVWTLPAHRTKNERALRVPLSPLARSIIATAISDEARPAGSKFVFTTTGRTPVSGFTKGKRRLDAAIEKQRRKRAESSGQEVPPMSHWVVHDLRTTFATLACEMLRVDAAVADRILNHVASATTSKIMRTYNRSELFEPRRQALAAWGALLQAKVIDDEDGNVIQLNAAAR